MNKHLIVVALLSALSLPALATQPVDTTTCNGNGSCATNNTSYNTTNNAGGVATSTATGGTSVATGGSSTAYGGAGGSSTVKSDNTNFNANTNQQGQQQGQGQAQAINNSGNSAVKNSGNSASSSSIKNSGNSSSSSENTNNNASNADVDVTVQASKSYRPPVNSAIAPTIFPTAPCMGSSSLGGSATLISLSGGTSWTSDECMILETARSFDQAGYAADGLAVRCQGKWAKSAPSCQALDTAKHAMAVTPAVKKAVAVEKDDSDVMVLRSAAEKDAVTNVTYSSNGYFSTVTNPLAQ